jgi:hypothetical protein
LQFKNKTCKGDGAFDRERAGKSGTSSLETKLVEAEDDDDHEDDVVKGFKRMKFTSGGPKASYVVRKGRHLPKVDKLRHETIAGGCYD